MTIDTNEMNRRLIALAESPAGRFWRVDYAALSVPERTFRSVWELEAEVNNGGFEQYFSNSSGRLAPQAPAALRAIGAVQMATIVDEAIAALGADFPWLDDEERQERATDLPPETVEQIEALEQRFFSYPDDLTALLYAYVGSHRDDIGAPPGF